VHEVTRGRDGRLFHALSREEGEKGRKEKAPSLKYPTRQRCELPRREGKRNGPYTLGEEQRKKGWRNLSYPHFVLSRISSAKRIKEKDASPPPFYPFS